MAAHGHVLLYTSGSSVTTWERRTETGMLWQLDWVGSWLWTATTVDGEFWWQRLLVMTNTVDGDYWWWRLLVTVTTGVLTVADNFCWWWLLATTGVVHCYWWRLLARRSGGDTVGWLERQYFSWGLRLSLKGNTLLWRATMRNSGAENAPTAGLIFCQNVTGEVRKPE